jgi:hypothetical protein
MKEFFARPEPPALDLLEARVRAQELVLQCLCKAVASFDARSAYAIAVALEVAELERAELAGEDDAAVRVLRRFREQCNGSPLAYAD